MEKIFKQTQQLNVLLRETSVDFSEPFPYQVILERAAKVINGHIFGINSKRNCLGYGYASDEFRENKILKNFFTYQKISEEISDEALKNFEISDSVKIESSLLQKIELLKSNFADHWVTIGPIEGNRLRLGSLFVLTAEPLSNEQIMLLDTLSTFIGNQASYIMLEELESQRRENSFASLIQSLSRPELETFKTIIEKIDL
ncbi:GAF domain-containing protein [Lactococcus kimchii]|uniref:transcriptional regulator n=1 Tax=Lactococcus sp. S-13 TaxID=2507158 RepID=UPI0010236584|nr:transcriptional regulator [Lactococcus sp. S-13]RZI48999.1 transcriptional regulator [Lactococcus sp. S-13]